MNDGKPFEIIPDKELKSDATVQKLYKNLITKTS